MQIDLRSLPAETSVEGKSLAGGHQAHYMPNCN